MAGSKSFGHIGPHHTTSDTAQNTFLLCEKKTDSSKYTDGSYVVGDNYIHENFSSFAHVEHTLNKLNIQKGIEKKTYSSDLCNGGCVMVAVVLCYMCNS